ncbi:hypothetical protein [Sphingopyxis granuli]|uniref:hypothetical protein n=1 Tax=Sphingopyxis granuli TaxID=267128 RepID=UPI00155F4CA8|nr:hypothetical protein [Sphingopyxis granuli]
MRNSSVSFLADIVFCVDREKIDGYDLEEFGVNVQIEGIKYPAILKRKRDIIIHGKSETVLVSVISFSSSLNVIEGIEFNIWSGPSKIIATGCVVQIV